MTSVNAAACSGSDTGILRYCIPDSKLQAGYAVRGMGSYFKRA